jgi:hypothetical protein
LNSRALRLRLRYYLRVLISAPIIRLRIRAPQEIDEHADPQRQVAALRKYRIDIVAGRRILLQHRHQPARLDLRTTSHIERQARPRPASAQSCSTSPSLHTILPPTFSVTDLAVVAEGPAALAAFAADRQAVVLRQVVERRGVPWRFR